MDWDGWNDLEGGDEPFDNPGSEEWAAYFQSIFNPTPNWATWIAWALDWLTIVLLAIIVMEQWVVWFAVTSLIWSPWGMGLGIAVAAAQILAIFSPGKKASCPQRVPR